MSMLPTFSASVLEAKSSGIHLRETGVSRHVRDRLRSLLSPFLNPANLLGAGGLRQKSAMCPRCCCRRLVRAIVMILKFLETDHIICQHRSITLLKSVVN